MRHKSQILAMLVAAIVVFGAARQANAATVLVFGQNGTANTVTATDAGGVTTIVGDDIAVTLTAIENGSPGTQAVLDFTFTSTGPATVNGSNIEQNFGGFWTICGAVGDCTTNYLSGTFTDLGTGSAGGAQFTVGAGTPLDSINPFTSTVATSLGFERSLSFAFTNLSSPLAIVNGTIDGFTASVAGNFSGNIGDQDTPVPEPASMMLLGSGLVGLAAAARRRRRNSQK